MRSSFLLFNSRFEHDSGFWNVDMAAPLETITRFCELLGGEGSGLG